MVLKTSGAPWSPAISFSWSRPRMMGFGGDVFARQINSAIPVCRGLSSGVGGLSAGVGTSTAVVCIFESSIVGVLSIEHVAHATAKVGLRSKQRFGRKAFAILEI